MSHTSPNGTPATRGDPGQKQPEKIGTCIICGKDLYPGNSYIQIRPGPVCHSTDCLIEALQEAELRINELEEQNTKRSTQP